MACAPLTAAHYLLSRVIVAPFRSPLRYTLHTMNSIRRILLISAMGLASLAATATGVRAQQTLAGLQQVFQRQFQEAQGRGGLDNETYRQMLAAQIGRLETFLKDTAKGDDRFNGRLMLVDMLYGSGDATKAKAALQQLDTLRCPALILLQASAMADQLTLAEQAGEWKALALQKPAPFRDRVTMAILLMTRLRDVKSGEAIFARELETAEDDERRAEVGWYRATAIREREDMPEGNYYAELQKLAEAFPETRFGRIAADRIKAGSLKVGDEPLELGLKHADGKPVRWADYKGKVVVVEFWASWQADGMNGASLFRSLRALHGDKVVVVSVNLDEQRGLMEKAKAEWMRNWPQLFGGQGMESEVALRWLVEIVPHVMVLDTDGKLVANGLHTADMNGRRVVADTVQKAVDAGS